MPRVILTNKVFQILTYKNSIYKEANKVDSRRRKIFIGNLKQTAFKYPLKSSSILLKCQLDMQ